MGSGCRNIKRNSAPIFAPTFVSKNYDNKKNEINILISLRLTPLYIISLVAHPGLEPGTPRLKVLCSTNWASGPNILNILIFFDFVKINLKFLDFFLSFDKFWQGDLHQVNSRGELTGDHFRPRAFRSSLRKIGSVKWNFTRKLLFS